MREFSLSVALKAWHDLTAVCVPESKAKAVEANVFG